MSTSECTLWFRKEKIEISTNQTNVQPTNSIFVSFLAPAQLIQIWYTKETGYDPINFACQLEIVPLGLEGKKN